MYVCVSGIFENALEVADTYLIVPTFFCAQPTIFGEGEV